MKKKKWMIVVVAILMSLLLHQAKNNTTPTPIQNQHPTYTRSINPAKAVAYEYLPTDLLMHTVSF